MHRIIVPAFAIMLAASMPALAQSSGSSSQPAPNAQSSAQPSAGSANRLITAQKVRQDLEKAGFSDVKVVAESFVVQAKSKDGDPVLLTIGPHGFTLFEAEAANNKASTTGSTSSATAGSPAPGASK